MKNPQTSLVVVLLELLAHQQNCADRNCAEEVVQSYLEKKQEDKQNKNNISFTSTLLSWQKQYLIVRVIILCYSTVRVWLCDTLLGVSTKKYHSLNACFVPRVVCLYT